MGSIRTRKIRQVEARVSVLSSVLSGVFLAALGASAFAGCATNGADDGDDGGTGVTIDASTRDAGHADVSLHEAAIGDDDAASGFDAAPDDAALADASVADGDDAAESSPPDAFVPDAACAPTPLACDGLDHKCDGIVDEGCPSGVTFGAPTTDGPLWGNPSGGVAFSDACPTGQVLIGMSGHLGASIDGVGGLCGIASLNEDTTTTPHTYSIAIIPGSLLPSHGGTSTTAWTRQCPANQAVIGVAGQSGSLIDGVTLSCAPLVVSGAIGAYTMAQGTAGTLNYVGGTGGSAFSPFTCPSTQIARVIGGRGGNSLDALSISCGTPAFTLH